MPLALAVELAATPLVLAVEFATMLLERSAARRANGQKFVHMLNGGKTHTALQGQSQAPVGCAARSRQGSLEWVSEQRASRAC